MQKKDIIIGIHSILEAIKNPRRSEFELFATKQGLEELKIVEKQFSLLAEKVKVNVKMLNPHELQQIGERKYKENNFKFSRIPSQVFLLATCNQVCDIPWLFSQMQGVTPLRLLCLDQVTDVQNRAAIIRTAAFFNVHAVLISQKTEFDLTPSFFRISSGALEFIKLIRCSNLSRFLRSVEEKGVRCIGLSEHAKNTKLSEDQKNIQSKSMCLVLGSEDKGLSHSVIRVLNEIVSIQNEGKIKSLNVSVAAAIAMDRYFGIERKSS